MWLFFAIPMAVYGSLFAVSGVLGITRGWVFLNVRGRVTYGRRVRRVRLYGWGQLVVAFGLCWQAVFGWVPSDPDTLELEFRPWGIASGMAVVLTGLIVMLVSQYAGRNRQGGGMS
ncbi:hypothetical protein ACFY20_26320 [Streptomyces sp. NPDC001312]|uniref:hypothetical protein n=1 Tax=Streptomyces sp. NPDC001312 TaxID=3364561 RepID=UPI003687BB6C